MLQPDVHTESSTGPSPLSPLAAKWAALSRARAQNYTTGRHAQKRASSGEIIQEMGSLKQLTETFQRLLKAHDQESKLQQNQVWGD